MNNLNFVVFDVEIPNKKNERMSSIGLTLVENGQITEKFSTLVNPEQPFDKFISKLTKLDEEAVKDAPTFLEIWPQLELVLSKGILVAHNASFDMNVLKKCLRDYKIQWKDKTDYLCTVQIGRKFLPNMRHNLNIMCSYYNIPLDHHRADSDSNACAEILLRYIENGINLQEFIRTCSLFKIS